ncbi:hypothetical protein EVAR_19203_1 [Eumeta japonica]|uniref:Uncharacterized protein n=1 Tax=Eumeta variegata TaxID=151549 RepID=A0A4C1VGE5_EUMVA|nr:hypothetical protein EVAR_19203_1 [Eumeta japonica]
MSKRDFVVLPRQWKSTERCTSMRIHYAITQCLEKYGSLRGRPAVYKPSPKYLVKDIRWPVTSSLCIRRLGPNSAVSHSDYAARGERGRIPQAAGSGTQMGAPFSPLVPVNQPSSDIPLAFA